MRIALIAAGLLLTLTAAAQAQWWYLWGRVPTPSGTGSENEIPTATPSTASGTATRTGTRTRTPTITKTFTRTPTITRTVTPTSTLTVTRTFTSTRTVTPTRPPTNTRTETRTPRPTSTPDPDDPFNNPPPIGPFPGGGNGALSLPSLRGTSPAQKLASALLVFPLIQSDVDRDTRIELVNMTSAPVSLNCFYLRGEDWTEIGFFVSLTPNQPLSWLASTGARSIPTFSSVPPFVGEGDLKCGVIAATPDVSSHNAIQGRAIVFDNNGQAASYSAVAFRRLADGDYTGIFDLDNNTYENCPDRLHFDVLAVQPGSESEIILAPCNQDFENQQPSTVTAQFQIVNEFEQVFSASYSVRCWDRRRLDRVSSTLNRNVLGSDTGHVIVRGVQGSLVGLVLDNFTAFGNEVTTGNEPFLNGGRSGQVIFP